LRARISVSKSVSKQEVFQSPKASVFYGKSEKEKGSYSETNGDVLSYDGDLNATFGKLFDNKHMVNAVVGMQVSDNKNKTSGFRAIGYVDDRNITPTFSNGYPSGEKPSYSNSQKRSASYYMNGGYAYDNRYLLDANFRADGSSVFGVSMFAAAASSAAMFSRTAASTFSKTSSDTAKGIFASLIAAIILRLHSLMRLVSVMVFPP